MVSDDRTARARIRDAAIRVVAEGGTAATTVRRIATAADVSAGLVIHHYGSMEALQVACDEHVAEVIREQKSAAMTAGPSLDPLAALRDADTGPLLGYLARRLMDDAPAVARLVDDLVADSEEYLRQGIKSGMLRPIDDLHGTAAVLMTWSLGALVLHQHVGRLLGIDLTDPDLGKQPEIVQYIRPAMQLLGEGIFTGTFMDTVHDRLDEATEGQAP